MMHEVGLDQSEREGAVSTDGRIGTNSGSKSPGRLVPIRAGAGTRGFMKWAQMGFFGTLLDSSWTCQGLTREGISG